MVTPSGVIRQGCVEIDGEQITAVAEYPSIRDGHWILPGFVDMHTHGGGGHTFTTGDPESVRRAADFHLAHGTTTLLASLVSSPIELMRAATTAYAPLVGEGVIAGIHYEGPYLSDAGAAPRTRNTCGTPIDELSALLDLGGGAVRMVTLAPERPGALDAINLLVSRGVVAALGHTDATYEQTRAAIDAGATVGTHVFNGMRAPHHREPGPVYALLGARRDLRTDRRRRTPARRHALLRGAGRTGRRTALVTDAMAAAGMSDGDYELGGQAVVVTGRVARLAAVTAGRSGARRPAPRPTHPPPPLRRPPPGPPPLSARSPAAPSPWTPRCAGPWAPASRSRTPAGWSPRPRPARWASTARSARCCPVGVPTSWCWTTTSRWSA